MMERITKEDLQQHADAGRSIEDVAKFYGKTYRAIYQMCVKKKVSLAGFKPRPRKEKEPVMITGSPIVVRLPVAESIAEDSGAEKTSTRIRASSAIMKEIVDCDLHIRRINRRRAQLLNELTDSFDQESGQK
jgi:hypothetical protein